MASCKACGEPLVLHMSDSDDEGEQFGAFDIPDDVELSCRCHYHWQCLMDNASTVISTLQCPCCGENIANSTVSAGSSCATDIRAILVRYTNEGGIQDALDISASVMEEAYLEAHPDAAPARAFHVMCASGDVDGLIELLYYSGDQVPDLGAMVRYQDPLHGMKSGLHLAIENRQDDVIWLLLWVSSLLPSDIFPPHARQSAESIGLGRLRVNSSTDIRGLLDGEGRSAAALFAQLGAPSPHFVDTGVLTM